MLEKFEEFKIENPVYISGGEKVLGAKDNSGVE